MMEISDPESNIMFLAEKVPNKSYLDWYIAKFLFDERTIIYAILTANKASFVLYIISNKSIGPTKCIEVS